MPIVVKGFDGNAFDQRSIISGFIRFITTMHLLVFSGSYTTGGDTLDWTNGGVNSAVPAAQGYQTQGPIRCDSNDNGPAAGVIALGGNYVVIPGTLLTNWKVKVFKTAGSEYSGAYLADVLTDTVFLRSDWAR